MFREELPLDRSQRWALLGDFIDQWFRKSHDGAGVPGSELVAAEKALGFSLPPAFNEWYARYGSRADVWSQQDRLLMPHELAVDHDVLIFCIENQGVVRWGIRLEDLAADDPPVIVSDPAGGKAWFIESPTTSAFAIQFALLNAKWCAAHGANGQGTDEAFAAIERCYARLPFADMHWPASPTRFYGSDQLLIETNGNTWIWASARSEQALGQVDSIVRAAGMDGWEVYEGA